MTDSEQELEKLENELAVVEIELQEWQERRRVIKDRISELKAIKSLHEECTKQQDDRTWEGTDFPWTQRLEQTLKNAFKLSSLRPMQRQTMNATLSKEDCLLIMPTGGGKSLCFQLPALVDKGLTLVVSPLVSLMEDQQIALELLDIPSAMLNAATSKDRLKYVQDDMVNPNGKLRILYVTPEKLAKSKRFMNRLEKCYAVGNLARIVIDEVHCCSQWGHDFRPDYKFLGIMKRQFPRSPILGLTATATIKVLEDVKKILNIPKALLFRASFNRPNLYFEVCEKPSTQKDFLDVLYQLISHRFVGQSGIVYCFSRKDSEEVTIDLQSRGVKAGCYNADVDPASRSKVHRKWLSGEIQVVVATVAFGMGIDKPNVRFVIHHSLSKSMENLYQESGRAGRDEKRSDCILFYRLADVARQSSMVFTEMTGLPNLHGIVKYCIDVGSCRRSLIAHHFGEVWDASHCNSMCDHCDKTRNNAIGKKDVSKYCLDVLSILNAAADTEQRVTSAKLTDAWYGRGHAGLKVKSVTTPTFGKETAERILAHMLISHFLQEDFHFTAYSTICYIVAGPKAKLLQNNVVKVIMDFKAKAQVSSLAAGPQGSTPTVGSSSAVTPSASSTHSSSTLMKKKASSTSFKAESAKKKPKLVVVNKEKLHFNDLDSCLPTSLTLATNKSSSEDKPRAHQKTSLKVNKTKIFESDDLNFDDSDEKNFKQTHQKVRRTKKDIKYDCKVTEETSPLKTEKSLENGRKRKHSNEDDLEIKCHDQGKRKGKQSFVDSDTSFNSSDNEEKTRSIVISDDEANDET